MLGKPHWLWVIGDKLMINIVAQVTRAAGAGVELVQSGTGIQQNVPDTGTGGITMPSPFGVFSYRSAHPKGAGQGPTFHARPGQVGVRAARRRRATFLKLWRRFE